MSIFWLSAFLVSLMVNSVCWILASIRKIVKIWLPITIRKTNVIMCPDFILLFFCFSILNKYKRVGLFKKVMAELARKKMADRK